MQKNKGFTLIELLMVVAIIGIVTAVFLGNGQPTPDQSILITPTNVTSRYNRDFDEEVGVVATASQGDFIILRNTSMETYIANHVAERKNCEVDYGTKQFGRYKVIIVARCE